MKKIGIVIIIIVVIALLVSYIETRRGKVSGEIKIGGRKIVDFLKLKS